MSLLKSKLLSAVPGIEHGFGSVSMPIPASLASRWHASAVKKQVHGTGVVEIVKAGQDAGSADAFFSRQVGVPVSIISSDCVPILLARRDGGMVAAVHAGWRGLLFGVIDALWTRLGDAGQQPDDWVAAVGPAIGQCCYQVSEELAQDFALRFSSFPHLVAGRQLDLAGVAGAALQRHGIVTDTLRICTACSRDEANRHRFMSYRRGDRNSQQHSGILMRATAGRHPSDSLDGVAP